MNQPATIWTLLVIGVTAYVTWRGFARITFLDRLIFEPVRILRDRERYRLVTAGFLHGDWPHFFFNMYSLYAFGSTLESTFGAPTFLLIYFAGIVGGNLLSLYLHRHHDYRALGASGGVCGIIFAAIFLLPGMRISLFLLPIGIPAAVYAILFIVISFVGMRNQTSRIGHDAHLGGALVSLLVATLLRPVILAQQPGLYLAVVLLTGLLLVYAYHYPAYLQVHPLHSRAHWQQVVRDLRGRRQQARRRADAQTVDELLDKVSRHGLHSLTAGERRRLQDIAKERQARGG